MQDHGGKAGPLAAAAFVLAMLAGQAGAAVPPVCGDVNESSSVTSSDALLVLKKGVGQPVTLVCTADTALSTCNSNLGTCQKDLSASYDYLAACDADIATCQGDLAECSSRPVARPLQTNQPACFDAAGATVACAGTGQDGEETRGASHSFTDNGDGTITDDVTGLMWEKLGLALDDHKSDTLYSWEGALGKVVTLNSASFAGHADWRLPNVTELLTIVNYGFGGFAAFNIFASTCSLGCVSTTCSCTPAAETWTSTTYNQAKSSAWVVDLLDGAAKPRSKVQTGHVRAVRVAS